MRVGTYPTRNFARYVICMSPYPDTLFSRNKEVGIPIVIEAVRTLSSPPSPLRTSMKGWADVWFLGIHGMHQKTHSQAFLLIICTRRIFTVYRCIHVALDTPDFPAYSQILTLPSKRSRQLLFLIYTHTELIIIRNSLSDHNRPSPFRVHLAMHPETLGRL